MARKRAPAGNSPPYSADADRRARRSRRSLSPGYAGIRNPLFDNENTLMVFSDAKAALEEIVKEVKDLD